jgi:hypothetical protein
MKSSKQFATSHGQSHYPSNMKHIEPELLNVTTPEGTPLLLLVLQRHDTEKPLQLNVRMTVFEAEKLIEKLTAGINNAQKEVSQSGTPESRS